MAFIRHTAVMFGVSSNNFEAHAMGDNNGSYCSCLVISLGNCLSRTWCISLTIDELVTAKLHRLVLLVLRVCILSRRFRDDLELPSSSQLSLSLSLLVSLQ